MRLRRFWPKKAERGNTWTHFAGAVFALTGDLGAGKTVFAKGFAEGLDITAPVTSPTFTLLQHLYNCAITRRELDSKTLDAYQYLVALLMKDIHRQTIREKSMSAVILDYAGYHGRAQDYAESLRQYTACDAERGRTFDTPRATYSWYSYKNPPTWPAWRPSTSCARTTTPPTARCRNGCCRRSARRPGRRR